MRIYFFTVFLLEGGIKLLKDNVTRYRTKLGISILELARRSGVSRDVLYQIENGKRHNVQMVTIEKLAKTFNTTVQDLIK